MRIAANLSTMFQKVDLLLRYELAASKGFRYVEVSLPYSESADKLKAASDRNHLQHILINAPPGNWSSGERGIAALPSRQDDFKASLQTAIQYATLLNCKKIHVMAGLAEMNDETRRTYVENIRYASQLFAKNDIICLIEPINKISIPGYFLHSYQQALEIIKEINESNLKLMFDVFHAQQICGQLTKSIVDLKSFIGHVQIAQVPERHEPDSAGEINYEYIFKILKENGDWDIGCEYMERGESMEYFEWMKRYELI